jgi:DNA-binding NtrC family response regulator
MDPNEILLVDDDEMVTEVISRILRLGGYTVRTASGVDAAMEILDRNPGQTSLLVCDVLLRNESCGRLLECAMQRSPATEILLISGLPPDYLIGQNLLPAATLAGPNVSYRQKPFTRNELLGDVKRILARGAAVPPPPSGEGVLTHGAH